MKLYIKKNTNSFSQINVWTYKHIVITLNYFLEVWTSTRYCSASGWYTECELTARVSSYCNSDEESGLKRVNFSNYMWDPGANKVLGGRWREALSMWLGWRKCPMITLQAQCGILKMENIAFSRCCMHLFELVNIINPLSIFSDILWLF